MPEKANVLKVMISSTARDLPDHRKEVMEACLRQEMFPIMMEHLAASDNDAITESLAMVDNADIYIGIFGFRYGYVPKGHSISITEMECERAKERGIPRFIFIMNEKHSITFDQVDAGNKAKKLKALKNRLATDKVVNFFTSPTDLRGLVINTLSKVTKNKDPTAFHRLREIPVRPFPYIAHPYTLLQTHDLIGRQSELKMLTDWATANGDSSARTPNILSLVAIGGMGKSAVTWEWFNKFASQVIRPLEGQIWWSFYESDASFENFVIRALSYVTQQPTEAIKQLPPSDREAQLLSALTKEPFLIVLDGLERLLIAYDRIDASQLLDDDLDQKTANYVTERNGLPLSSTQSFTGQHRLRKTSDPKVGEFLRKLAKADMASRILISTRLYPVELQTETFQAAPGSKEFFLSGLEPLDALTLWRELGVSGANHELLPLFDTFERHPLLIRALAGEIAKYRHAPGDFHQWCLAHPDFTPATLPAIQVKCHVLSFALQDMKEELSVVLRKIAAFRMPVPFGTLTAILTGDNKYFIQESELDSILTELEDRGLVGWDRKANRYDLHPLVRSVSWSQVDLKDRQVIYGELRSHFESISGPISFWGTVRSLDELTGTIELFNALVGEGRYADAFALYDDRLHYELSERLKAHRLDVQLLELVLLSEPKQLEQLTEEEKVRAYNFLSSAYRRNGQPQRAIDIQAQKLNRVQPNLLIVTGALQQAENLLLSNLQNIRKIGISLSGETDVFHNKIDEAIHLTYLGLLYAIRGVSDEAQTTFDQASEIQQVFSIVEEYHTEECEMCANFAQWELIRGNLEEAWNYGDRILGLVEWFNEQTQVETQPGDCARAKWLLGRALLQMEHLEPAEDALLSALLESRTANLIEDEIHSLIGLAKLRYQQSSLEAAKELLEDVWELVERGPYPLLHAEALNISVEIERDLGNLQAAIQAAQKAHSLALCDGPPYTDVVQLATAQKHLRAMVEQLPAKSQTKK